MKIFLLSLIGFLFCLHGFSQQEPHYSQYMFNELAYNPGYAGSRDEVCMKFFSRLQWVGMPGAPKTNDFNVDAPVKPFNINSGIGMSIVQDIIGFNHNLGIGGIYSYKLDVGSGKLGIGVILGVQNQSLDASQWFTTQTIDGTVQQNTNGDLSIPSGTQNVTVFDMGLGFYYSKEEFYLGLSSQHLTQPTLKFTNNGNTGGTNASMEFERNYIVTGGYNLRLTNPLFEVAPSFYINTDIKATEFMLNTNVIYNKRFWGGLSYRFGDAIVGIFGIEMLNGIQLGFSYDFAVSGITAGSYEIWVGYNFKINRDKTPQKYKSVRFL